MDEPIAVHFRNVVKSFPGTIALRGLELAIPRGSLYVLLGPNGAGKTTALKMLAGIIQPDLGSVLVNGINISEDSVQVKRQLAYLPDEPLLYPQLRPVEYLEFIAALWGMHGTTVERRAEELLQWLDLWDHRGKFVETFSRGMKQKLALAGALLHNPTIILMDEPITGLDVASAKLVKDLMKNFVENGNTIILTTHIMELAETFKARIGIINRGKMVIENTFQELQEYAGCDRLEDIFLKIVNE